MPLLAIVGPTASGKTDYALRIAAERGAELISVDSRQVYKHLVIGTAKPSGQWTGNQYLVQGIPYHLLDIWEPSDVFNAADFVRLAELTIQDIEARGREAILVGGTGLYYKALLEGLAPLPGADESIRSDLRHFAQTNGRAALHDLLKQVDPEAAASIPANNITRLTRALEIYRLTGKPISQWHREHREQQAARPEDHRRKFKAVGVAMDKDTLHKRISERCAAMLENGMIDETQALLAKGYSENSPALTGLGYPRIVKYLAGELSRENLLAALIQDTRQYAKRQMTWFRNQMNVEWKRL